MVSGLVDKNNIQTNLFSTNNLDQPKQDRISEVVDKINKRYGRNSVKLGVEGFKNNWTAKSDNISKKFTTDWKEILEV